MELNSFAKKAEERKQAPPSPRKKSPNRGNKTSRATPVEEEDTLRITVLNKAKRAHADSRNKYPLNEVKGDHVEKL